MSDKDGADSPRTIYSRLSTQRIEEMLRFAAFSDGELDMEHVDLLLAELKKRETESLGPTPEEALEIFRQEYSGKDSAYLDCAYQPRDQAQSPGNPQKKTRRRSFLKPALVAAAIVVFLLGSMVAAQAAGIDVFGAVARWTDEVFSFSSEHIHEPRENSLPSDPGDMDYQTVEEALKAYGIEKQITPTWIPDGFEQMEFEFDAFPPVTIYCLYTNEASSLIIHISITDSPNTVYEKTDAEVQIISIGNVDYYLMENIENNIVVWYTEGCECFISGNVSKDTLVQMIESIHE